MERNIKDLLRAYANQTSDDCENEEASAYFMSDGCDYECCQLCTALSCLTCCEAMCSG